MPIRQGLHKRGAGGPCPPLFSENNIFCLQDIYPKPKADVTLVWPPLSLAPFKGNTVVQTYFVMVYFLKVANESEVKGQVKLRFTDVVGKRYTVSRSMVSIQKVWQFILYQWCSCLCVLLQSVCTQFRPHSIILDEQHIHLLEPFPDFRTTCHGLCHYTTMNDIYDIYFLLNLFHVSLVYNCASFSVFNILTERNVYHYVRCGNHLQL